MSWPLLLQGQMDKKLVSIDKLIIYLLMCLSVAGNCYAEPSVTIAKKYIIPDITISEDVKLGGISDLIAISDTEFYIITDRGPNGKIETPEGKLRTLLSPEFKPRIFRIKWNDRLKQFLLRDFIYIKGKNGYCNGKPNSDKVKKILNADGTKQIVPDIDGVDPEGVVRKKNGSFIITEEYGPSIIFNGNGERYMPLSQHRDNRGFEAVALSEDEKYLWTMLQSPVDEGDRVIPFIIFNLETKVVDRRLNYTLEEDTEDGKVCCMSRYNKDCVLVLEQSDTTPAKLFLFNIKNEHKTLFVSLENILPEIAHDISNGKSDKTTGLKLEGMDFIDSNTIAIVNDNDFDEEKNNCLWILKF